LALTSTRWISPVPSRAELRAAARLCVVFLISEEGEFYFVRRHFSERRSKQKNLHQRISPSHVGRHTSKPPPRRGGRSELAAKLEGLRDRGWGAAEQGFGVFFLFYYRASESVVSKKM
jgi:hypothetical protein